MQIRIPSPIGPLRLTATGAGLTELHFEASRHPPRESASTDETRDAEDVLERARCQLEEYFARRRTRFDLPLELGGTPFQLRVWSALRDIAFGSTESYGELARRIGAPAAVRAVGAANGRNPIAIIVPCHRVIGANGALTGFGGGIGRKRWLLRHESASPELPLGGPTRP
jgi:methylated-DNA-[protein]-cysteine S-methyltransferase